MISTKEDAVIYLDTNEAQCDGGQQSLGHPTIYLSLKEDIKTACPYCSQLFCFTPKSKTTDQ